MLVVGSNVMEQLAHVGSRIQDAVENGCKVVAADPRTSRIAPQTHLFMHPRPGADLAWIRALAKTIIDRGLYIEGAPEIPGFEELRASLQDVNFASLSDACGVTRDEVERTAQDARRTSRLSLLSGWELCSSSRRAGLSGHWRTLPFCLEAPCCPSEARTTPREQATWASAAIGFPATLPPSRA